MARLHYAGVPRGGEIPDCRCCPERIFCATQERRNDDRQRSGFGFHEARVRSRCERLRFKEAMGNIRLSFRSGDAKCRVEPDEDRRVLRHGFADRQIERHGRRRKRVPVHGSPSHQLEKVHARCGA